MTLFQDMYGYDTRRRRLCTNRNQKMYRDGFSLLGVDIQSRHPPLFRHLSRSLEFLVIRLIFLRTQQCTLNTQKSPFTLCTRRRFEVLDCEFDLAFNLFAILINIMATTFVTLVAQAPHPIGAALGAGIGIVIGHPFPRGGDALAVYTSVEEVPAYKTQVGFVLEANVAFDDGAWGGTQQDEIDGQPDEGDCVFVD